MQCLPAGKEELIEKLEFLASKGVLNLNKKALKVITDSFVKEKPLHKGAFIMSDTLDGMVTYDTLPKGQKNLIIIDDFLADKNIRTDNIKDLFFRCRKRKAQTLTMTQSFFSLTDDIRTQGTHYALCRGSDGGKRNALLTMQQAIAPELSPEEFKQYYKSATERVVGHTPDGKNIMGFLYVDKMTTNPALKYRCCFDRHVLTGEPLLSKSN